MLPKFLRNMLGGDEDSAVEFDDIDRPSTNNTTTTGKQPATAAESADLPEELLDAILAVINSQLPPIVAECIDRDAQRRRLAGLLGQPLSDFAESARRKAVSELTGDRAKMQSELDSLRAERKEVAGKREEQKAALLSEQRQRRALSDRNRDLEAKIDQLDSEIEQYKLTISSLMNKMRVAEVTEGDSSALHSEIEKLNEEIKSLKETIGAKEAEITSQAEKIAEFESRSAVDAALEQRRESTGEADGETATPPKKRRSRQRKQTAVYDPNNDASADIDSVDWLLPGGVPAGHVSHVADPDFGYQPPKQAPEPDPDAQLTLF
ncbi:MAG: hypothetical protein NC301_00510 [Bacteroides sp.]|nr:hypothetical protein [Bacteroides sp.]MCM1379390.1 hypothetical protein [Bacteroides sp.]MCM1445250.1 hypothetical protein [Prevotella sp.]